MATRKTTTPSRLRGLGPRLRSARISAGLTQRELAQRVGVDRSAIGQLETRAMTNLRLDCTVALARALEVSTDWLLTGREFAGDSRSIEARALAATYDRLPPRQQVALGLYARWLEHAVKEPGALSKSLAF